MVASDVVSRASRMRSTPNATRTIVKTCQVKRAIPIGMSDGPNGVFTANRAFQRGIVSAAGRALVKPPASHDDRKRKALRFS